MNALLIGCDYENTSSELRGCSRDVKEVSEYLVSNGYSVEILCDDDDGVISSIHKPTSENVLSNIEKFASLNNEKFFFYYSGHGIYTYSNTENDKRDELIVCIDNVCIRDDTLNKMFSKLNSKGIFLFDACHSGTIMDFKYLYDFENDLEIVQNDNENNYEAILISGCKDDQTSADAYINNNFRGAMTTSFLHVLSNFGKEITAKEFILEMRKYLKNNYTQIPQLSYTKLGLHKLKMSEFIN